jgi:hypothetical protein
LGDIRLDDAFFSCLKEGFLSVFCLKLFVYLFYVGLHCMRTYIESVGDCSFAGTGYIYHCGLAFSFSSGDLPTARIDMNLLSRSNQNGAPTDTARVVTKRPMIFLGHPSLGSPFQPSFNPRLFNVDISLLRISSFALERAFSPASPCPVEISSGIFFTASCVKNWGLPLTWDKMRNTRH